MILEDYIEYVRGENDRCGDKGLSSLLKYSIGLSIESSEFLDELHKTVYFNKDVDKINMMSELGDILYYFMSISNVFGVGIDDIIKANICKLKSRYPDGHRDGKDALKDKNKERQIIKEILENEKSTSTNTIK
jgi:NTP pyrophosphatase (non-canonical NTP hydrolase)